MPKSFGLELQYRMTCSKKDPKNICHDSSRKEGFYWLTPESDFVRHTFQNMEILNSDSIGYIMSKLEKIELIAGAEAVKAELHICLPGSTGVNGHFRKNINLEFFRDLKGEGYNQIPAGVRVEPETRTVLTLRKVDPDGFGRERYQNVISGKIYVYMDGEYYSVARDGEPDCPLRKDIEVVIQD